MIIETKNLTKHYQTGTQTVKALNGINLSVNKGVHINYGINLALERLL